MRMHPAAVRVVAAVALLAVANPAWSQVAAGRQSTQGTATSTTAPPPEPPEYVIGANDVLSIHVWQETSLSGDVVVRPDGKITLPLVGDIDARGLAPAELAKAITEALQKSSLLKDPRVTVIAKQINSRKVCVQGEINKIGCFDLNGPMSVLTLISMAGGLQTWADKKNLTLVRAERRPDGTPWTFRINYEDLINRRNMDQNYELKPGDILIVK